MNAYAINAGGINVNNLTQKAKELYRYLIQYKMKNDGLQPTMRQMIENTGYKSTGSVRSGLNILEKNELIHIKSNHRIVIVGGLWVPPVPNDDNHGEGWVRNKHINDHFYTRKIIIQTEYHPNNCQCLICIEIPLAEETDHGYLCSCKECQKDNLK